MDESVANDDKKASELRKLKAKYDKEKFRVVVRFDKDDREKLQGFADQVGVDLTTYIRRISLNPLFKIAPAQPRVNLETKAEIQKIGVNLNQIARSMNNRYEPKNFSEIEANLHSISKTLQEILVKMESNDR